MEKKHAGGKPSTTKLKELVVETYPQAKFEALSALTKISTAIGFMPMDIRASLEFLVKETRTLFDAHGCAILSLNNSMDFDLILDGPPDMCKRLPKYFKSNECMVVRDEFPLIVKDTKSKAKRCQGFAFDKRIRSHACLPISTGTQLIGILMICSLRKQAFTQDHLEMMLSVATLAASVIQRAQLFNKLEREKQRLEKANEKINKLNSDLEAKIEDLKNGSRSDHSDRKTGCGWTTGSRCGP